LGKERKTKTREEKREKEGIVTERRQRSGRGGSYGKREAGIAPASLQGLENK